MPSLTLRLNWRITVFTLALLPVLIALGFWQLDRAEQKKTIQDNWAKQQVLPAIRIGGRDQEVNLVDIVEGFDAYQRVEMAGQFYPNRYWLAENRIFEGRLGYEVIMPFKLDDGNWLAINRGWVPSGQYREDNPDVATPNTKLILSGVLIDPSDSLLIDERGINVSAWPHRILEINIPLMSEQFGQTMLSKVLILDESNMASFVKTWRPANMGPTKHKGYAVQWFTMAFALFIMWVFANTNLHDVLRQHYRQT